MRWHGVGIDRLGIKAGKEKRTSRLRWGYARDARRMWRGRIRVVVATPWEALNHPNAMLDRTDRSQMKLNTTATFRR
jgi:hypothetical protein